MSLSLVGLSGRCAPVLNAVRRLAAQGARLCALFLLLTLAAVGHAANAAPSGIDYRCDRATLAEAQRSPAAGWLALINGELTLPQGGASCWVRIPASARNGQALSFVSKRAAVAIYDSDGQLLGQADRYGTADRSFVTIERITFDGRGHPGALLVRLALDPYYGYAVPVKVEQPELFSTLAQEARRWTFQVGTLAALLVISLVALLFAFALRGRHYLLFALYALSVSAIVAFRLYLPQTLMQSPQLAWIWFCIMYPAANALGLLVFIRLGRFDLHSPLARRVLMGVVYCLAALVPFWYVAAYQTDLVNSALHVLFFPVLYWACWRGWRSGDLVCLLLLLSNVPIALFWVPGFIADLTGIELLAGLSAHSEWTVLASDLVLPLIFLGLLAQRTLTIREKAHYFELNDPITGLPNRADLQRLENVRLSPQHDLVVLVPNVKRFRVINEALGTRVGDQLLAEIGQRLQRVGAIHVARLHADQFCLVTTDARLAALRASLEAQFRVPAEVNGQVIDLHLAIGVARESDAAGMAGHGAHAPLVRLVRNAEIALDVARAHYLDWVEYDRELETGRQSDLGLLSELGRAIEREEFRLFLQPKIRMHDGVMISAEALLRWQHPTRGLITPEHFVPFAEKTGCIRMITHWVLGQVMALTAELRAKGQALQVSVNLSAYDLGDPALLDVLTALLLRYGADPADIRLEMTEHSAMGDAAVTLAVMDSLTSAGFSLSIDDFGTGYSSLSYLQKMPVSELKIDRAFVHRVEPGRPGFILLQSIVELGHRLGLSVVAEGVETREEWEMLRFLHCDFAQGYFAAAPMNVARFAMWRALHTSFDADA